MKHATRIIAGGLMVAVLLGATTAWANSPPVVNNVTASQRTDGSKLVDIGYSFADADGDACTVTVQASNDAEATWTVPITAVTGAIGAGITPGVEKHIVWDCGTEVPDWEGTLRIRVRAAQSSGEAGVIVGWGVQVVVAQSELTDLVAVAAGSGHSLGLKADGSIKAWGWNGDGQCNVPAPNSGFVGVAAGQGHSLGLKADGSIVAWGRNYHGQCNVPAPNSGFVAIAGGCEHSLGLKADGSLVAWGWNDYGQCNVPAPNSGFVAVAGGPWHSLGLKADGSVVAWGSDTDPWGNYNGQCNVPAPNSGFVGVAAGWEHSLGLKADGSIVAWGSGATDPPAPNSDFVAIAAGAYHSLGRKADGSIVAWGADPYWGILNVPAPNTGFVGIAGGYEYNLGLKADGSIVAWGANYSGQCNVPPPNSGFVAVAANKDSSEIASLGLKADGSIVGWGWAWYYAASDFPTPNSGFIAVAAGEYHFLGLKVYGSVVEGGSYCQYRLLGVPAPNANFAAVAAGFCHSLGLKDDGSIVAWGDDYFGQCDVPAPNSGFVAVAAGYDHSMGLKSNGSIVAWGRNDAGQRDVPAPNSGFVALSGGGFHSLGLKADGSIVAWGGNWTGQCDVPAPNSGFVAIAGGRTHSLGLKADGSIVAWGSNGYGKCNVPEPNTGFVAIAAGDSHSLGLKSGLLAGSGDSLAFAVDNSQPKGGEYKSSNQVQLDRLWIFDDNLQRFVDPNGPITLFLDQPTYIFAHGWDGNLAGIADPNVPCYDPNDPQYSWAPVGQAIHNVNPSANILAWDWADAAAPNHDPCTAKRLGEVIEELGESPSFTKLMKAGGDALDAYRSGLNAAREGNILGPGLAHLLSQHGSLGTAVHLIGHSHGGGVMGVAAQEMKKLGQPATTLTTLDTPHLFGVINTAKYTDPSSVSRATAFYYSLLRLPPLCKGAGHAAPAGATNVKLNCDYPPPSWLPHLWINDGWYLEGLAGSLTFGGAAFNLLEPQNFPAGNFEENDRYEFVSANLDQPGRTSDPIGWQLCVTETFDSAAAWTGTNVLRAWGADPADPNNSCIVMSENGDASFFRTIDWPRYAGVMNFDYMFRDPRGDESLTVYLSDQIIYYDHAATSLATGNLMTSEMLYVGEVAGMSAQLAFVLRTDGTPGGSLVLDNVRIYIIPRGDMNCDGSVNFKDINPFVLYLSDVSAWQARFPGCPLDSGDINGDGTYPSFKDINPFVVLLSGGGK